MNPIQRSCGDLVENWRDSLLHEFIKYRGTLRTLCHGMEIRQSLAGARIFHYHLQSRFRARSKKSFIVPEQGVSCTIKKNYIYKYPFFRFSSVYKLTEINTRSNNSNGFNVFLQVPESQSEGSRRRKQRLSVAVPAPRILQQIRSQSQVQIFYS